MRKLTMKRKLKTAEKAEDSQVQNGKSDENGGFTGKKAKRNSNKNSKAAEVNGSESEVFEVEAVLDQKIVKGAEHYLIRWKGYGSDSDSWEPKSTLNCPELIEEFLKSQKPKGKKGKSKTNKPSKEVVEQAESSEDEDEKTKGKVFEVDKIIEVHHKKNGKKEFLVHWKGYPSTENTWEPEENMNCPHLIEKFMAKVDKAKEATPRELRVNRKSTEQFTLSMDQRNRRLSRRNMGKQRIQYKDAE